MSRKEIAISDLVHYLKKIVDNTERLKQVKVIGELSNVTIHPSGHWYFTLKDDKARLDCVMFRTYNQKVQIQIEEGQKVIVEANVTIYEPTGKLQLFATGLSLQDDMGDLYAKYQALYKHYEGLGYFRKERKKEKPVYPERIAVISAKEGAATQDVFHVLQRRWPLAQIFFYPSLVQGERAEDDLVRNLKRADREHYDAILLVRGGGSIEDLWCFNSPKVVEAIFQLHTYVIAGVGHEPDHTLCEYVSDTFGPTPSAAAELLTPSKAEVELYLSQTSKKMHQKMHMLYELQSARFDRIAHYHYFKDPLSYIQNEMLQLSLKVQQLSMVEHKIQQEVTKVQKVEEQLLVIKEKLQVKLKTKLLEQHRDLLLALTQYENEQKQQFSRSIELLQAYSPLHVLQRGYSITKNENQVISSIQNIDIGEELTTVLSDGVLYSTVQRKEETNGN